MAEMTPMMKQYLELKGRNPDSILFFRLGDFYEMFFEDAKVVSKELDLTLTTRDRTKPLEERTPMCGVPYHSCDSYIARLLAKGYKVAICEQMEDPVQGKGIVDRDVVRIITPGTVMSSSMLEEGKNNFLASIYIHDKGIGLCFCDLSTGEVFVTSLIHSGQAASHLENELGRFQPREVILSQEAWNWPGLTHFLEERLDCIYQRQREEAFGWGTAHKLVQGQFGEGVPQLSPQKEVAIQATGGLLDYLYTTQRTQLHHITQMTYYTTEQLMELDLTARQTLELTATLRSKEKRGSLLWVLDQTKTPMGGRLIRGWMERPLLSVKEIERRQQGVANLVESTVMREELARVLAQIPDLERLIGRVVYGSAGGRDLVALAQGMGKLAQLQQQLTGATAPILQELYPELDPLPQLCQQILSMLVDEPPFSIREGKLIRPGQNAQVDRLNHVIQHGAELLAQLEGETKEKTGIKSLKVSYNKVFGYYIEVAKAQSSLVPQEWVRKQTTVHAERYISQELKELEHTILSAKDQVVALEYQLFCQLKEQVCSYVAQIQRGASAVAQVDVLQSLGTVAVKYNYCMPQVEDSLVLHLEEGRHPVVEQMGSGGVFVPNHTQMDGEEHLCTILTGPNMAGKSTYMRQVALIVLMAQMGSFVPAKQARIGIVDRVFTRIGASDDLASGQSTFMVEMNEVALLLSHATRRSLLVLDEIGRGTSTYDGMAIAQSVLEYCTDVQRLGCKTLFATHYHELTALEQQLPGVKNYNIGVKKRGDQVVFLHTILRGGADQSYGIEVAQLAGLPPEVIQRARDILKGLEEGQPNQNPAPQRRETEEEQEEAAEGMAQKVLQQFLEVDLNHLTPIQAHQLLAQIQEDLRHQEKFQN